MHKAFGAIRIVLLCVEIPLFLLVLFQNYAQFKRFVVLLGAFIKHFSV